MGTAAPSSLPTTGELPNPRTLEAYKNISPQTLEVILDAFRSELKSQQKLADEESHRKTKALEAQIAFSRRGQIFGLLIGVTAVVCGTLLGYQGHELTGSFIGGGGVIGLVSVFVIGHVRGRESADNPAESEAVVPGS